MAWQGLNPKEIVEYLRHKLEEEEAALSYQLARLEEEIAFLKAATPNITSTANIGIHYEMAKASFARVELLRELLDQIGPVK
jgi:hypothetical protein